MRAFARPATGSTATSLTRREYPGDVRQSKPTVTCECRYFAVLSTPGRFALSKMVSMEGKRPPAGSSDHFAHS